MRKVKDYPGGLVERRRARETGRLVGLYHGEQSGIDSDPDFPWVTVCEDHGTLASHPTLTLARDWMAEPTTFCEQCRAEVIEQRLLYPTSE